METLLGGKIVDKSETEETVELQTIESFFENTPPNEEVNISNLCRWRYSGEMVLNKTEIKLHCENEHCKGLRFFRSVDTSDSHLRADQFRFIHITYRCSNCGKSEKVYSIAAKASGNNLEGVCFKLGERPPFGPPIPSKLINLIGPDRDQFLKGYRSENQGLGIGAFAYYRRVVENQKNRILGEIIKVSEQLNAPSEKVQKLNDAIKEVQFSKALEMSKDAIPESLLIKGHNPLLLLHAALSEGLHALTDEACLRFANSIRVILGELSESLAQALKDKIELTKAISTLLNKGSKKD